MAKSLVGARASLKINGKKVAWVGGFNISQQNTLQRIDVLDQLPSAELAEVGHVVSFSANMIRINENKASALGLDPRNIDALLTQGDLTMEVYDRVNDEVAYEMTGVKFEGGDGTLDARGVWTGTYNFQGLRGYGI